MLLFVGGAERGELIDLLADLPDRDELLGSSQLGPLTLLHPVHHRVTKQSAVHLCSHQPGLALHGELDLMDAEDVLAAVTVIAETTDHDMDLDLSELSFLDVAGARALALSSAAFDAHGHHLHLVGARPTVRRCLDLFGFNQAKQ